MLSGLLCTNTACQHKRAVPVIGHGLLSTCGLISLADDKTRRYTTLEIFRAPLRARISQMSRTRYRRRTSHPSAHPAVDAWNRCSRRCAGDPADIQPLGWVTKLVRLLQKAYWWALRDMIKTETLRAAGNRYKDCLTMLSKRRGRCPLSFQACPL